MGSSAHILRHFAAYWRARSPPCSSMLCMMLVAVLLKLLPLMIISRASSLVQMAVSRPAGAGGRAQAGGGGQRSEGREQAGRQAGRQAGAHACTQAGAQGCMHASKQAGREGRMHAGRKEGMCFACLMHVSYMCSGYMPRMTRAANHESSSC